MKCFVVVVFFFLKSGKCVHVNVPFSALLPVQIVKPLNEGNIIIN